MIARLALAVLLAATPVAAQEGWVQSRTRAPVPGDVYRFESRSDFVQTADGGDFTQTNRIEFTLEVLDSDAAGMTLRYKRQDGDIQDSGGAGYVAAFEAAKGLAVEFRLGSDGQIQAINNWTAYREAYLARLDAVLPATDPVSILVHQRYSQTPLAAAKELVLGDVAIMSTMEPQRVVALGSHNLLPVEQAAKARATLTVTEVHRGCRLRLDRDIQETIQGLVRSTISTAEISALDGRVLTQEQRRVSRGRQGSQTETVTIRRLSTPPAC